MNILGSTKKLCSIYNINPSRSKGQNFLINESIYNDIVTAAELKPDDTVLEVGPGLGFLTEKLAKKVKRVIAVELDDKLAQALRDRLNLHGVKNVEVVNEDILEFGIRNLESGIWNQEFGKNKKLIPDSRFPIPEYKIVANLPYNITSIFLRKFLSEAEIKPVSMTLMIQKEVAERIAAVPPKMSLLAVSVQIYAESKIISYVSKENFWPAPKVDSAVIKLEVRKNFSNVILSEAKDFADRAANTGFFGPWPQNDSEKKFFRLVKYGFSARRKMLKNNLSGALDQKSETVERALESLGLNPKIRAEGLSVADWIKLFGELKNYMV